MILFDLLSIVEIVYLNHTYNNSYSMGRFYFYVGYRSQAISALGSLQWSIEWKLFLAKCLNDKVFRNSDIDVFKIHLVLSVSFWLTDGKNELFHQWLDS